MIRVLLVVVTVIATALIGGCEGGDGRLVGMARESADRQAEQNRQMAQLQGQVAEGARRLIEAGAQARQELTALQRDLRADQAEVGRQRDQLEAERREIAKQRHRDPIIAAAMMNVGLVLACLLPLVLCGYLLYVLRDSGTEDEAVTELLIEELVADRPRLLPPSRPPPALQEQPAGDTAEVASDEWTRGS